MLQENKRTKQAKYVSNYETMFACPLCKASMMVIDLKSIICANHHTFDIAKQGYINFLTKLTNTKYGKDLFEARREFIAENGFFKPLSQAIAETINMYAFKKEKVSLIDMGCGEGSHLSILSDTIRSDYNKLVTGAGIDFSKEGIIPAAKNYTNMIWAVADLTRTPFKDKQFDVILNILSPSNYAEFRRLLKADGIVIKIVPQSDYLKELREVIFDEPEKQSYSTVNTIGHFKRNFQLVNQSRLHYIVELNHPSLQKLIQMTPLSWRVDKQQCHAFLKRDSAKITVDLEVLIGMK